MTTPDVPEITLDMMREHFYSAVVCDALDELGFTHQSPRVQLAPYTGCLKLVGRAKTVLWADVVHETTEPFHPVLQAIDSCQPDEVFISATGGTLRAALWGELFSAAARNAGCVGAIINGAVRDVAKIRELGFPVFARGTLPYDSNNRQRVIGVDVPVEIDGVIIHPGDLVIADEDGVIFVPQEVEHEAVRQAWEKVQGENVARDAIHGGMKIMDAFEEYGVV